MMSFTTKSGGRLVIAEATGIQQPCDRVRRKTGDRKSHRDPARRSISSPVQRESPQQGKKSQKVEGPSARQYAGTPGPRGRVMSARQHDQCGPGVASVHRQGVSTPVRKLELARQHAERLPPIEYDRHYAASHRRHRHGPSTSRCRSSYKLARRPLPRPSLAWGDVG